MNKYEYWFGSAASIKYKTRKKAIEHGISPEEIYRMNWEQLSCIFDEEETEHIVIGRKGWNLDLEEAAVTKKGADYITAFDSEYPDSLRNIPSMPYGLYVKGKLPRKDKLCAAVVGARKCSPYGRKLAEEIGHFLAKQDVQVVSGLARGIDSIAQKACVEAGGITYGILACGVDICYPYDNIELYMKACETGGIISEQPLGTQPIASYFPARNRIISGLADFVIVVEAEEKSGSLITADFALDQGRDVLAVPGRVTDKPSMGCNHLIYQGAEIYLGTKSLEKYIEEKAKARELSYNLKEIDKKHNQLLLEKKELMVYSCLSLQAKSLESIVDEVPLLYTEVVGILMDLQLKGLVMETTKNSYVKA